jgi:hypothetical protein
LARSATCRRVGPSLRPVGIATPTPREGAPIDTASSSVDARPLTVVNVLVSFAGAGTTLTRLGWFVLVHASAAGKNCATNLLTNSEGRHLTPREGVRFWR